MAAGDERYFSPTRNGEIPTVLNFSPLIRFDGNNWTNERCEIAHSLKIYKWTKPYIRAGIKIRIRWLLFVMTKFYFYSYCILLRHFISF